MSAFSDMKGFSAKNIRYMRRFMKLTKILQFQ
nr:hypothetical protein [Candidatus Protochlamydia sp. W-9]